MIALVVAALLVVVAATSMQRRVYLRWVSGWVGRDHRSAAEATAAVEALLVEPLAGRVVGTTDSDFSGAGYVALVESGLQLTERPGLQGATWGAFWHEVTGYAALRHPGRVWIDVSGSGRVHVETGGGAVLEHWDAVLRTKGVPCQPDREL